MVGGTQARGAETGSELQVGCDVTAEDECWSAGALERAVNPRTVACGWTPAQPFCVSADSTSTFKSSMLMQVFVSLQV